MATSVETSKETKTLTTNPDKKICEHLKITRKTWNQQQSKLQEGKLYRGRPQKSTQEEARNTRGTLGLRGNRCHIATRIRQGASNSTAQLAAKQHNTGCQQTTVLQHEGDSADGYITPRSDEILFELHKILVFRDKDPFINAVCAKRRSKPKVNEKNIYRERKAEVKNGYFRKTTMTVGERALDEGKAANSRKLCANGQGKNSSGTSTEIGEESETKDIELLDKDYSQKPTKKQKAL